MKDGVAVRTVCLIGGPLDGTRSTIACGELDPKELLRGGSVVGRKDGSPYEYAILGLLTNGELLGVEV